MLTLRPYQQAAITAIYGYFQTHTGNPLVVIPTAGGKSLVMASFIEGVLRAWPDQRILIVTHVRELIAQNHAEMLGLWALRSAEGLITSGTASFRPGRYDGGGMRYLRFTNWLTEIDRLSGPIAAIWFEEVRRHAGTDAAHVYGGLMATLTA